MTNTKLSVRDRKPIAYRPTKRNDDYIEELSVSLNISKTKAVDLLVDYAREQFKEPSSLTVVSKLELKDTK